ncbi:hypothetical protein ACFL5F_01160 [Planctomycetota bacterium]
MELMDYIAVIASILTILSVCLNVIQKIQRVELIRALRARSQAGYNYFFQVARRADTIRALAKNDKSADERLEVAIRTGCWITGCADAARNDIISYSREHLHFLPVEEHPAKPIATLLPRPKKKTRTSETRDNQQKSSS